jgi:hypothetical protein
MWRAITSGLAGVLLLALAGAVAGADDATEARKILDEAIKAHGGADKLAKLQTVQRKESGKYHGLGNPLPYTANVTLQLPDKMRLDVVGIYLAVLDGDKGWVRAEGETKEMTKEQLAGTKAERYVDLVTNLVPLSGKEYKLEKVAEVKVNGQPAAGVKVTRKDRPAVTLYFDKKSGLLVKTLWRPKSAEKGDEEVNQETVYSDFKEMSGVKVAQKVTVKRDGELYLETEREEVKPIDKPDKDSFAKP